MSSVEEMMYAVCGSYRGVIVVMDVIWRILFVSMFEKGCFICYELGKGAMSEAGKYLLRAANLWWRGAQYFVIATYG